MARRGKERELTSEDAIYLAKRELAPFWLNSPPLLMGVQEEGKSTAHPLAADFREKKWAFFFADPLDFSSETLLTYLKEWHHRYHEHDPTFVLVLVPGSKAFKTEDFLKRFLEDRGIDFPLTLDTDGSLSRSFELGDLPGVCFLDNEKKIYSAFGSHWYRDFESFFQRFLRQNDPGLPLAPLYVPDRLLFTDDRKISLGTAHKSDPGVSFTGEWTKDEDGISTSDPSSTITIQCNSYGFSVLGESGAKTLEYGRLTLEVDDRPAFDNISGRDLRSGDTGETYAEIRTARIYHLLSGLTAPMQLVLRFPTAKQNPLRLYGFRFSRLLSQPPGSV